MSILFSFDHVTILSAVTFLKRPGQAKDLKIGICCLIPWLEFTI